MFVQHVSILDSRLRAVGAALAALFYSTPLSEGADVVPPMNSVGHMPLDAGGEEWGRRSRVGAAEGAWH